MPPYIEVFYQIATIWSLSSENIIKLLIDLINLLINLITTLLICLMLTTVNLYRLPPLLIFWPTSSFHLIRRALLAFPPPLLPPSRLSHLHPLLASLLSFDDDLARSSQIRLVSTPLLPTVTAAESTHYAGLFCRLFSFIIDMNTWWL